MAAQIEVLEGPDKGWRFIVTTTTARIGKSAAHTIRLTDPHWPEGALCIEPRGSGYAIINNLPYSVFLDGKTLQPTDAHTLHHGATLQPTSATLLKLSIITTPANAEGVRSEPPPPPKPGLLRRSWPWLFLFAAFLPHLHSYLYAGNPVDAQTANALKESLVKFEENGSHPATTKAELRQLRLTFTDAVYLDSAGRFVEACTNYRDVRDILQRLERNHQLTQTDNKEPATRWPGNAHDQQMFGALEEFTANRLKVTASTTTR